jgi:hypothetical protein
MKCYNKELLYCTYISSGVPVDDDPSLFMLLWPLVDLLLDDLLSLFLFPRFLSFFFRPLLVFLSGRCCVGSSPGPWPASAAIWSAGRFLPLLPISFVLVFVCCMNVSICDVATIKPIKLLACLFCGTEPIDRLTHS